jgi:hypothetical protein
MEHTQTIPPNAMDPLRPHMGRPSGHPGAVLPRRASLTGTAVSLSQRLDSPGRAASRTRLGDGSSRTAPSRRRTPLKWNRT